MLLGLAVRLDDLVWRYAKLGIGASELVGLCLRICFAQSWIQSKRNELWTASSDTDKTVYERNVIQVDDHALVKGDGEIVLKP